MDRRRSQDEPRSLGEIFKQRARTDALSVALARHRWEQIVGASLARQSAVLEARRGRVLIGVAHEPSRQRFMRLGECYKRSFGALPDGTRVKHIEFKVLPASELSRLDSTASHQPRKHPIGSASRHQSAYIPAPLSRTPGQLRRN